MRINLLPIEERPLDSFTIRWEFAVILLGIVLLLITSGYGIMQSLAVKSLKYEYESAVDQGLMLKFQRNEITTMQDQNRVLETKLNHYQEITNHNNNNLSIHSLTLIMESIPANIWIEDLEMQSNTIYINGYTFDTVTVSQFLRNLSNSGFQTTVKQLNQSSTGKLTSFVIEIQRG